MTTNRKHLIIVLVLVVLSVLLSACSTEQMVNTVADASSVTTGISVQSSSRIASCDFSASQLLFNDLNSEIAANNQQALEISTNDWLDSKASQFPCITAQQ
jgi:hypothetical protein